jgi:hypothetical protein
MKFNKDMNSVTFEFRKPKTPSAEPRLKFQKTSTDGEFDLILKVNETSQADEITIKLGIVSIEEMEEISGGKNEGGYDRRPQEKPGCVIYKIAPGQTLGKIARANGTTVEQIMKANKELKNPNFIRAGAYIYLPV